MKSTAENLSPTRVRLSVEVPFEEVQPSLDAAYKKIASQLRVPGFRPGKVPARVIDQRIGRTAVLDEAVNDVVPKKYVEAAREHEVKALGQPDIEVTNLDDHESLSFTADVDVRPEITLPDFDGLTVTVDDAVVTDDDVDTQLNTLRERFGSLKGVDRAVGSGDYVSLDLQAEIDGTEIEAGTANGISYEVGSGDLIDGLDDAITGKTAGDSATFTATLRQGDRSGDEAQITAKVNSVKEKELPALDDEFAQLASEFDTIDELKADLRTRLESVRKLEQGGQARDRVVEQLIDAVDFPLPESPVQAEVDAREHEIVHTLNHDDALFELREAAEKAVRAQFVLDAIADSTNVEVGDAELTEYLVRQASRYEMAPQEFATQVMQSGNLPALVADVRRNKALAGLLEAAVVTDASGNTVDLSALGSESIATFAAGADEDDEEPDVDE